ncbi:hypothetical protein COS18_01190, partial [Candidatus Falkowbacteria bacterium CG02_land_8_20_14_3_00_36_14]
CVINDSFSTAITEKMTVGQAMKQGYLNPNGIFGFISADGLEPRYNEGYPYRSMLILRKFRIIPVGWEVAAELVKDSGQTGVNLEYMVNCFDPNDNNYKGPSDGPIGNWCRGLVDPSWVLKAPQNFCAKEGYGPEKISEIIIGKEKDSILIISRDNKYCADEQSCIKEDSNGACQLFGYCTAERRKWDFSSASCEPKYNTCQTFQAPEGGSVSYL